MQFDLVNSTVLADLKAEHYLFSTNLLFLCFKHSFQWVQSRDGTYTEKVGESESEKENIMSSNGGKVIFILNSQVWKIHLKYASDHWASFHLSFDEHDAAIQRIARSSLILVFGSSLSCSLTLLLSFSVFFLSFVSGS